MKTKIDQVNVIFEKQIEDKNNIKNGAQVLQSLIDLQTKILNKKEMIEQKTKKISSKFFDFFSKIFFLLINFFF